MTMRLARVSGPIWTGAKRSVVAMLVSMIIRAVLPSPEGQVSAQG